MSDNPCTMIKLHPLLPQMADNRFYLACQINHKQCQFLIDTGAQKSRICTQLARYLNLPANSSNGRIYVDANVEIGLPKKQSIRFFLEDENFKLDQVNAFFPYRLLDGILGMDYLKLHPFSFDFREIGHPRAFLYPNIITTYSSLRIERDTHSRPYVYVTIDGINSLILLDTGAKHTEINFRRNRWTIVDEKQRYGTSTCFDANRKLSKACKIPISLAINHEVIIDPLITATPILGINTLQGYMLQYDGQGHYTIGK